MGIFTKSGSDEKPAAACLENKDLESNEKTATSQYGDATEDLPFDSIDPVIEARLKRKLDFNLLPLVFFLYLLASLDRSNIGNARIAGMEDDLDLVGDRYSWLLNIFYISYILFEFQILAWKCFKPHQWAAFVVFGWGVVSTCQAAVQSWAGEMVLRFFLGVCEAGYGTGIPFFLSFFYLRHEVGFRQGMFVSAAPLATCFAGALAYGITSGPAAIASWRVLFLAEGLPTIAMAPVVWFCMPDSPQKARFLDEDEKRVALVRTIRQVGPQSIERKGAISLRNVLAGLADFKPWVTSLMYFSCNVSFASLPVFLPTILEEMGFESVTAQGLTAPPYFLAFLVTVGTTWLADRTQQRGLMIVCLSLIGGVGYIMLATTKSTGPRYAGVFLAASGVFPCIGNILPWVSNNQGNDDRRGVAYVMLNVIGQCGSVLASNIYPKSEGPYYTKGVSICAAFMFFTTFLAITLRTLLARENRKLDREYGTVAEQEARDEAAIAAAGAAGDKNAVIQAASGVENYGPRYRYVL
ncbi:hypothetical protein AAFC00_001195 [Neodothiora populina]|uniref:MFS transporter n=1 Tax=Neodothiora populina TaxID=2781224 RepID=A0ABR3PN82_9PEZI